MRLLFAITVGCFCAVLWIALALARRIRLAQLGQQQRPVHRPPATREFFEAGEFRTPRPLRLEQEIFQQKPRRPLSEITFTSERPAAVSVNPHPSTQSNAPSNSQRSGSTQPIPIRPPAAAYASLFGETVAIARIDSHISEAVPLSAPVPFTLHRKPPQAAHISGLRSRVDLSQYNKAMGDLTDPYTHPMRGSGTQGPVAADRTNR